MNNPSEENAVFQGDNFLLVGERAGVAADEEVVLTAEDEDGILLATSISDLADELTNTLPVSNKSASTDS